MEKKACIQVAHLYKKQGKKEIIKNISFTAKAGRVTALLGQNGAGKSSTLRILLGLDRPTAGTALFAKKKYTQLPKPLHVVGASFEGIGGVPARKVNTHLQIIAQSNGLSFQRIAEVLKLVGLADKRKARLGTLSLGEGQRLGLAIALLGNPQYLVLDEPTNGLDPSGVRWFQQFIRQQAKQGKTILLSSHHLFEIEAIADDVVMVHQGQVIASGKLTTMLQTFGSLEHAFFAYTEGGVEQ